MSAEQTIPVNNALIEWARQESGYGLDVVAKRLQVRPDRLREWEEGKRQPTFRQIENLARLLHRPLSVFFLPRPPQLPPLSADYRRLPGIEPGRETPELRLALRQMLNRRETAINLMEELGEQFPSFPLRAHLTEEPAEVGARLRAATEIDAKAQLSWLNEWQAWRSWRSSMENLGVLVFQFGKVSIEQARGLCLLKMPLPVAAVNGKEIPEAKSFTLFHEMVHLMLAAGNDEKPANREQRRGDAWNQVERFAEAAAGHALVPDQLLRQVVTNCGLDSAGWTIEEVRRVAKKFKLTPLATATRLREAGYMSWSRYHEWREEWQKVVEALPPRRGGFATPADKTINRAGRPFAQLVLEALSLNRITTVEASRYLDLKFEHFDALSKTLSFGPQSGASE